jgi:hypothetical protein
LPANCGDVVWAELRKVCHSGNQRPFGVKLFCSPLL